MKAKIPVLTLLLAAFASLWLLPQAGAQVNIPYTNNFDNPWDVAGGADPDFAISIAQNYPDNSWQIVTNDPTPGAIVWLPNDGSTQGFASIINRNTASEYSCALLNIGQSLAAPQAFVMSSNFKIPVFETGREGYVGLAAYGNHANLGTVGGGYGSFIWAALQLSTGLHNGTGSTTLVDFVNGAGATAGITQGNQVGASLPMNTNDTYSITMVVTYDYNTNMNVTVTSVDVTKGLTNSRSEVISYATATASFLPTAALPGNGNYFGYCDRQDPNNLGGPGPYDTNITVQTRFSLSLTTNPPSGPPQTISATISPRANLYVGASATLNASFSGVTPMQFKWQFGGTNIASTNDISTFSTSSSLVLSSLQVTNAGYYRCYATNTLGAGATAWTYLTVFPVPANPLINVQVSDANNGGFFQQGAAVLGNAADVWNAVNTWTNAATNADIALFDTTGAATPVRLSYTPGAANYINSSAVIPLFSQYLQSTTNTTVTLSGLQANATYNLVVYAIGNAFQGGVVSGAVNGTSAGGPALVSDVGGFTNGVNYVQNQSALSDGTGTLTFSIAPLTATANSAWNGLQITASTALPTVSIQPMTGGQLQVAWSGGAGQLLQTTNLLGGWTTNAAPSPYTFTPTGPQLFFRAQ